MNIISKNKQEAQQTECSSSRYLNRENASLSLCFLPRPCVFFNHDYCLDEPPTRQRELGIDTSLDARTRLVSTRTIAEDKERHRSVHPTETSSSCSVSDDE